MTRKEKEFLKGLGDEEENEQEIIVDAEEIQPKTTTLPPPAVAVAAAAATTTATTRDTNEQAQSVPTEVHPQTNTNTTNQGTNETKTPTSTTKIALDGLSKKTPNNRAIIRATKAGIVPASAPSATTSIAATPIETTSINNTTLAVARKKGLNANTPRAIATQAGALQMPSGDGGDDDDDLGDKRQESTSGPALPPSTLPAYRGLTQHAAKLRNNNSNRHRGGSSAAPATTSAGVSPVMADTQSLLFRSCAIPTTHHLFSSDVYYNYNHTHNPDIFTWESSFSRSISAAISDFTAHLGNSPTADFQDYSMTLATHPASLGGLGIRDQPRAAKVAFIVSLTRSIRYATVGVPVGMDGENIIMSKLTTEQARPLASWQASTQPLFNLFRILTQQALPTFTAAQPKKKDGTPTITFTTPLHFVQKANLAGLASKVYRDHSKTLMTKLENNAPPELAPAFPSIKSTHTSQPLTYYCRTVTHNRLDDDVFTVLWQRKLRMPLTLRSPLKDVCPICGKPMDPYGDHFFMCSYHKGRFSNAVRDALCNVLKQIAPLAHWTSSPHDAETEPAGLLGFPYEKHRPADVALRLHPSATNPPLDPPIKTVAMDVTVTSSPSNPSLPPATKTTTLNEVHLKAMKSKLTGKPKVDPDLYFHDMITRGILLMPVTIDPFGAFGFHAHTLLYGKLNSPPAPPPPGCLSDNDIAALNLTRLKSQPRNLFQAANKRAPAPPSGMPHHSPAKWATHALALHISVHLARHLIRSINQHAKASPRTKPTKTKFLARPLRAPRVNTFLDPTPHYLQPMAD